MTEFASVGCSYGQTGNRTEPTLPSRVPPSAYGCGEQPAWLADESRGLTRDTRHDREDRLCPADGAVPDGVSTELLPTPWAWERRERVAAAGELVRQGLRGTELDAAIDREIWKRRVETDRQRLGGILELFSNVKG